MIHLRMTLMHSSDSASAERPLLAQQLAFATIERAHSKHTSFSSLHLTRASCSQQQEAVKSSQVILIVDCNQFA